MNVDVPGRLPRGARSSDAVLELDGFVGSDEAASIYAVLRHGPIPSSLFYIDLETLAAPGAAASLSRYLSDALAGFIVSYLRRLLTACPGDLRQRGRGFEFWTTCPARDPNETIYLHVDCDEKLRTTTGVIRAPLLGSVLFLGPPSGLVGGETLFVTDAAQRGRFAPFRSYPWAQMAALADGTRVVDHRVGKLTLFAGDLPHGQAPVIDHPSEQPRVAFLANLWEGRIGDVPEGLCAVPSDEFRQQHRIG